MSSSGESNTDSTSQASAGGKSSSAWLWVLSALLVAGLVYTTIQMRKQKCYLARPHLFLSEFAMLSFLILDMTMVYKNSTH